MSDVLQDVYFLNTATNKKEKFEPLEPGAAGLYTCGPTVYDYAHIGNFRAYLFEDVLRRFLEFSGYKVKHIMNLTDVEDKIIRKSQESGQTIFECTAPYVEAFFDDLDTLNILQADEYPKATEHVDEMVAMIQTLKEKGFTYEKDGSIYFRIKEFKDYGNLSGIRPEEVISGARVDSDEYEKDDARDFVLWKSRKEGEHYWTTELGEGRPGWHIECSAMSMKFLGEQFDIHCGGEDNIFPHHENEIAQSEGCTGKHFVNYWLHCRHLLVDGEKMSKSKGNFYTLRDLLAKGFHPMAIRYCIISNHYRSPMNLSMDALHAAHSAWSRIMDFKQRLQEKSDANLEAPLSTNLTRESGEFFKRFTHHMNDDLDTPRACSVMFDFIREANKIFDVEAVSSAQAADVLNILDKVDCVLGVMKQENGLLDEDIERLIEERLEARKSKDYARADAIRDQLAEQGVILEDTREGMRWKRR